MILEIFLACLVLLLTRWHFDRKRKFNILPSNGYNVPPTNYVFGNLHQLGIKYDFT